MSNIIYDFLVLKFHNIQTREGKVVSFGRKFTSSIC